MLVSIPALLYSYSIIFADVFVDDVALIASFHYKKRNYHLVKLLEPIVIVGKRIMDIKGYYFTLLDDQESQIITPILENLMLEKKLYESEGNLDTQVDRRNKGRNDRRNELESKPRVWSSPNDNKIDAVLQQDDNGDRDVQRLKDKDLNSYNRDSSKSDDGLKKSKRRWSNRLSKKTD